MKARIQTIFIYACSLLLALIQPGALKAQTFYLQDAADFTSLQHVAFFTDETHQLSLDSAVKHAYEISDQKILNLGVSDHTYWVKFNLVNLGTHNDLQLEVPYPILDEITMYQFSGKVLLDSFAGGERYPFSYRANKSKNFIFPLNLKTGDSVTCYLRIRSGEQIILPIRIETPEILYNRHLKDDLFNGIYFGIIIVMILYNLFVFFSTKDRSYVYYVIYIFFVGLTQAILNGYAYKYLWPDTPWLSLRATMLGGAFSGLSTIFFVRNFLNTRQFSPTFDKLLHVFTIGYLASLVFCFMGNLQLSYNLINVTAGPGSFILLFTAINIYRKHKSRPALFFIISWSVFILSVITFVLKDVGVIPYNALTISGLQIGSAFVVTLLSIALADRINILTREKEKSQGEALRAAQENERIIREQNITLETKVQERTVELQETNVQLHTTLDELKQTQSQLVEQEKMASLGQLTAGIAHEINNPINFVSSNVKPLKRDVEQLIDLMNRFENIGSSEKPTEEKIREIAALKKEFDFDYLLEEINFLLKGINEGSSRTAEIVKGLRIFSRVDEDDIKLADIREGLESTLIIINNSLTNKIEVRKDYAELPKVECYPGKLNQVFLNILSNGIYAVQAKFGNEAGGWVQIKTQLREPYIDIIISDNGTGMDDETKKKLFEPFYTTKPVGEGTGLGLSIVYNTINKHNGIIKVDSELGKGTTFTISIPINQYKV